MTISNTNYSNINKCYCSINILPVTLSPRRQTYHISGQMYIQKLKETVESSSKQNAMALTYTRLL